MDGLKLTVKNGYVIVPRSGEKLRELSAPKLISSKSKCRK